MKPLVSFLILIFLCLAVFAVLSHPAGSKGKDVRRARLWIWWIFVLVSLALYGVATPIGSDVLRGWLTPAWSVDEVPEGFDPEYIVVLAGGMYRGADNDEIVLSADTALRIAHGLTWADIYPDARVILTGGCSKQDHTAGVAQLMTSWAVGRGLPIERIVTEPEASNTREHPLRVMEIEGVRADTPMLVVSSDYHLRRVRLEFDRSFDDVRYSGVVAQSNASLWVRLIPHEGALLMSNRCLHEIIGGLWYRLTAERG